MTERALSSDTDKRFVQAVLARGLADPRLVARLAEEHARGGEAGKLSLAQTLCERGVLDRRVAAGVLQAVRAASRAPAAPAAAPSDSRRIGSYAITGELGKGGMGVVYRAFDTRIRRAVALKMILDPSRADPEDLARFEREARAAGKVDHPGIVKVFDAGVHEGKPFIVMELVEGESFEALLKGPEAMTPRRAAEIVRGVAEALEHAHRQGIVHRDVKPQNILIDRAGQPRLADFGLARDAGATEQLTVSGSVLGTPAYLAPEQARGAGSEQGPQTDVYALGAVLYRALVGKPPFEASNVNALLMKVVLEEPAPLRRFRPQLHADLETIALRCLAKEPSRRYPSARAVAEDLGRFLDGEAIQGRPVGRLERLGRRARRNPVAALSLLLAVVAVPAVAIPVSVRAGRRTSEGAWQIAVANVDAQRIELERELDLMRPRQGENEFSERRADVAYRAIGVAHQYAALVAMAPASLPAEDARLPAQRERTLRILSEVGEMVRGDDNYPLVGRVLVASLRLRPDDRALQTRLHEIATVASTTVHERYASLMIEAGTTWYSRHDAERARRVLDKARALNGFAGGPWMQLALVSEETGDLHRALSEIQEGIARVPDRPMFLLRRASIRAKRKEIDAALQDYDRAIEVAPSLAAPYLGRIRLFFENARDEELLRELDRLESSPYLRSILEDRDQLGGFRRLRGIAEGRLERFKDAERHLTEAIELLVDARDVYFWRGSIRIRLQDREGAIADLKRYIADPDPAKPNTLAEARSTLAALERRR